MSQNAHHNDNLYAALRAAFPADLDSTAVETVGGTGAGLRYSWRDLDRASAMIASSGYAGRLVVMGDPEIRIGDGRLEWVDGGLVRDIAEISRQIDRQIATYLAARSGPPRAEEQG